MPDPLLRAIPYPQPTTPSHHEAILALKAVVELLAGMRGNDAGRSARYEELQSLLGRILTLELEMNTAQADIAAIEAEIAAIWAAIAALPPVPAMATTTEVLQGVDTAKTVSPDALAALWEKGANVASAATVSFGEGGFFHVTGGSAITDIDFSPAKDGRFAWVTFDSGLNLIHSATLKLPGNVSRTTQAGDRALFVQDVSDAVLCLAYMKNDGSTLITPTAAQISFTPVGDISSSTVQDAISELAAEPKSWRNRVINGDFAIDQRNNGALVTAGTLQFPVDRWWAVNTAPGTITGQRIADTTNLGEYYLEFKPGVTDASLAATDIYRIGQRIEGYLVRDFLWGNAQAQPVTVSFWVKGNAAFTLPIGLRNASSGATRTWLGSFSVTTGWTKVVITVPGDVTGTWEKTNLCGLDVTIGLAIGTTYQGVAGWQSSSLLTLAGMSNFMAAANTLQLKQFQVELGNVATEFERVNHADQLARCQRYYQLVSATGGGYINGPATIAHPMSFPVEMRATPTFSGTGSNNNTTGATFAPATNTYGYLNAVGVSAAGYICGVYPGALSAEL